MNDDTSDFCLSCGVPYLDHLGLDGMCAQVKRLTAAVDDLRREADTLRAALAEVLGWMTHRGSSLSGIAFVRSPWVDADRVEELRRLVGGKSNG